MVIYMIISFFEINDIEKEQFSKKLKGHTLRFFKDTIQNVDITKYIDSNVISVFIHSKVDKEKINKCNNLKLIATRSTGQDHIDIEFAKSKRYYSKKCCSVWRKYSCRTHLCSNAFIIQKNT